MAITNWLAKMHAGTTVWHHHLHKNEKLMFDILDTAAFIVKRLRELSEIHAGCGRNQFSNNSVLSARLGNVMTC